MKPVILSSVEKEKVLAVFKDTTQIYRLIDYLADNPRATRSEIGQELSIPNPSDLALKNNEKLRQFSLAIGCYTPPQKYQNKFGQDTLMKEWSLNRLSLRELKKPIKGIGRPVVNDEQAWRERQELLRKVHKKNRNYGLKKTRKVSA